MFVNIFLSFKGNESLVHQCPFHAMSHALVLTTYLIILLQDMLWQHIWSIGRLNFFLNEGILASFPYGIVFMVLGDMIWIFLPSSQPKWLIVFWITGCLPMVGLTPRSLVAFERWYEKEQQLTKLARNKYFDGKLFWFHIFN